MRNDGSKRTGDGSWRIIGSVAQGMLCHKPCTVSGGGKSEISKSINDSLIKGPVFVRDFHKDLEQVAQMLARDYSNVYRSPRKAARLAILTMIPPSGCVAKARTAPRQSTPGDTRLIARERSHVPSQASIGSSSGAGR